MMEKRHLLSFILSVLIIGNLTAKDFDTELLKLACSGFTGSAVNDMSVAENPYNWLSASGMQWTSENCFAQNVTASAYIGQAVRWGNTSTGVGKATTPFLNLSAKPGEQIKLIIKVTAGSNKTGSLLIKMGDTEIGTISAATSNDGGQFGAASYTFEYPIVNGTSESRIEFIHSKTEAGGNLYVQELRIVKQPRTIIQMDCSRFTAATASTEMSVAAAPHNWATCLGNEVTSSYCYAQNQSSSYLGQCVRLGATSAIDRSGSFTISNLDLTAPKFSKAKLYFEVALGSNKSRVNLSVKQNGDATPLVTIDTSTDGENGEAFGSKWYEYDLEITGVSTTSSLVFETSREVAAALIYIRNIRIYFESNDLSVNGVAYFYDDETKTATLSSLNKGDLLIPGKLTHNGDDYDVVVDRLNKDITSVTYSSAENISGSTIFENENCLKYIGLGMTAPAAWENVIKDHTCDSFVLTDGHAFNVPVSFEANEATYSRNLKNVAVETLCLPFATTAPADCIVRSYTRSTDGEVIFSDLQVGEVMAANTPYLVSGNGDFLFSSANAQEITSEPAIITSGAYAYTGTYLGKKGSEGTFYISNGTQFMLAGGNATIAPFRAYLSKISDQTPAPLYLAFGDNGGTTGVETLTEGTSLKIYSLDGKIVVEASKAQAIRICTITGALVYSGIVSEGYNAFPLTNGIYLLNGQKVVVR